VPLKLLAAEILEISIFKPNLADPPVREAAGIFQDLEPRHQPRGQRRPARRIGIDPAAGLFEKLPPGLACELHGRALQRGDPARPVSEKSLPDPSPAAPAASSLPPKLPPHGITVWGQKNPKPDLQANRVKTGSSLQIARHLSRNFPHKTQMIGRFFTAGKLRAMTAMPRALDRARRRD